MTEALVNVGNLAGFVKEAQQAGMSQRRTLATLRANGVRIRDSWFRSMWHEVAEYADREIDIGAAPRQGPVPSEYTTDWAAGRPGQYATQMQIFVRHSGSDDVVAMPYTHITNGPHSIEEAENAGLGQFDDAADEYEQDILGAVVTKHYRMIGRVA